MNITKRFTILIVFSLGLLPLFLTCGWLLTIALKGETSLARADVIFVFSGADEYQTRAGKAAEVYREGRAAKIVLTNDNEQSGWSANEERNPFYWELARLELIGNQVPAEVIEVLPKPVFGTHDEAVLLVKTAAERNWKSILLITSPFHAPRALWTTERVCRRENIAIKIGIESSATTQTSKGWANTASEIVKFIFYRVFY